MASASQDSTQASAAAEGEHTPVFDYVIFGATGDLAMRKLLPALYNQFRVKHVPEGSRIIGTARSDMTCEQYREMARQALDTFLPKGTINPELIDRFLQMINYVTIDGTNPDSNWDALKAILDKYPHRVRVFYFSTAPQIFEAISENLASHHLITPNSRVVLEKPIGTDSASAKKINDGVSRFFGENQIFRIDHYLGKETVQDILAIRFANPFINAVWSGEYIQSIQITAAETVGVEGRADYYDRSGAARDMIQNHLLQILSLCAMDPPKSLTGDAVRDAKVAVLKALQPITEANVGQETVRAQYTAGGIGDHRVPGYIEELGKPSNTETYAAVRAYVNTPRWKGVPFYLRTAKRSKRKDSEVVVTFKPGLKNLFGDQVQSDYMAIRLQPDEGFALTFNIKDPSSPTFTLQHATLEGDFSTIRIPDSYERLMLDAVRGNPGLFIRRDEVEAAWDWIEPTLRAWAANKTKMETYPAGSHGPEAANKLVAQTGDKWHERLDISQG
ncbi:glucose-6-phosphate dehydrogenase [Oecophyllibacter saccharovorans]|uniref:Glucose-6-phosphate 1-dehydrogenase n=1 Tax=Oecophyllibacter saccharovorans TaxID=2558360 RepID=A0A506UR14_9PROT|nr:glucose-6-phosphate dehydrogenase [Oecophyllibacter saccharovorans]QDH14659.1 glucose-6-phosphate dehydrogenase [Oecophyllibacter saccharovorans]TPW34860.1 glucose-6-phosphate dehydrogenase [Oecophyllibacter saccharovorans]TPW35797.1 glucose-6-phosphate dehydrogenase [Oecophyllibacter saccharovorans]